MEDGCRRARSIHDAPPLVRRKRRLPLTGILLSFLCLRLQTSCTASFVKADSTAGSPASLHDAREAPTLCLLMMVRNEEQNLRMNLPLWRDFIDCYVIGIDMRTNDKTAEVILSSLPANRPRHIFYFGFRHFSQGRNIVLKAAWQRFPTASHVLMGDADWRPQQPASLLLQQLDRRHSVFEFIIRDRSGATTRTSNWLLLHKADIRFKHRVHESLDLPQGTYAKELSWEVSEVETNQSWHTALHSHSRTPERYLFDLSLLREDYEDDPKDLHTLYNLGMTTFAYMETKLGQGYHNWTEELRQLVSDGMGYLLSAVDLYGKVPNDERVGGSLKWLGYANQFFLNDKRKAQEMYRRCIEYDPRRPDCRAFLARSLVDTGEMHAAWQEAQKALLAAYPRRLVLNSFFLYECFLPTQGVRTLRAVLGIYPSPLLPQDASYMTLLARSLLRHVRQQCPGGPLIDSEEQMAEWEELFDASAAVGAGTKEAPDLDKQRDAVLNSGTESVMTLLLRKWGAGRRASEFGEEVLTDSRSGSGGGSGGGGANARRPGVVHWETTPLGSDAASSQSQSSSQSAEEARGDAAAAAAAGARTSSQLSPGSSSASGAKNRCANLLFRWASEGPVPPGFIAGAPRLLSPPTLAEFHAAATATAGKNLSPNAAGLADGYRALIVSTRDMLGPGLESYEVGQVVSLHAQLAAAGINFEVVYLHPDVAALRATRALLDECGERFKDVVLAHGTVEQLLSSPESRSSRFNYIDVGGLPSAASLEDSAPTAALRALAGTLAEGGLLRAWSIANTPETTAIAQLREGAARNGHEATETAVRTYISSNLGLSVAPMSGVEATCGAEADEEDWGAAMMRFGNIRSLPQLRDHFIGLGLGIVGLVGVSCSLPFGVPQESLAAAQRALAKAEAVKLPLEERCEALAEFKRPRPPLHQVLAVRRAAVPARDEL